MTRSRWGLVAAVGAAIAGVLLVIGVHPAHAVLGGLLWLVVALVLVHMAIGQRVALPRLPFESRSGARTEVSSLSWSLYGVGGMTVEGQRHLERVLRLVLTEHGIEVSTTAGAERAGALLGRDAVGLLTDPSAPPPTPRTVRTIVLALEKLERTA